MYERSAYGKLPPSPTRRGAPVQECMARRARCRDSIDSTRARDREHATNQSTRVPTWALNDSSPSATANLRAHARRARRAHGARAKLREEGVRAVVDGGVLWDRQTPMGGRGGAGAACLQRLDGLAAA